MISVLLPVFNGEKFLSKAIDSILAQSYPQFELIILIDSSTDKSLKIANSYSDSRIKIINNKFRNLSKNLNYGLEISNFNFIARIDQDDTASIDRFEKQLNFLLNNKDYFAVFSWVNLMSNTDKIVGKFEPKINISNQKFRVLFENPFIHSSVMFRKNILKIEYCEDSEIVPPEDYELWSKVLLKYNLKVATLNEKLTNYRVNNPDSMTLSINNININASKIIRKNILFAYPNANGSWVNYTSLRLQNKSTDLYFNIIFSLFELIKIYNSTIKSEKIFNLRFIFYYLFKIHFSFSLKKFLKFLINRFIF